MMPCREAVNRLWTYLDGTDDAADRVLVEEHLARCRTCCGELEFARELRRLLAEHDRDELPADVMIRLGQAIEELGR